jgi:DNA-binding MarR family transcriptional regulator
MMSEEPLRGGKEPLARLFLSAAGMLVDDLHSRLAERGWKDVRHAWGFVLVRLIAGPASVNDLATFLGVSKQAASKTIVQMESHGLVRITTHAEDKRMKTVRLTPDGERFRADVEDIYSDLEAAWAEIIGREALELIRDRLVTALTTMHGGTLPPPAPLK